MRLRDLRERGRRRDELVKQCLPLLDMARKRFGSACHLLRGGDDRLELRRVLQELIRGDSAGNLTQGGLRDPCERFGTRARRAQLVQGGPERCESERACGQSGAHKRN